MEKQNYLRLLTQAVCTTGVTLSLKLSSFIECRWFFLKHLSPPLEHWYHLEHMWHLFWGVFSRQALFTVQPNWLHVHVYSYKYSSCKTGLDVLIEWFFSLGSVHFIPATEVLGPVFEAVKDCGLTMPGYPNWYWNCWTSHINCVTNTSKHYQERSLPGAHCARTQCLLFFTPNECGTSFWSHFWDSAERWVPENFNI